MRLIALRGANTVDANEAEAILHATEELMGELLERNRAMDGNDTTRTPAPATPASDPAHEPDSTADDLSRERTEAHR